MEIIRDLVVTDETDLMFENGSIYRIMADNEEFIGGRNFDKLIIKGKTFRLISNRIKYKSSDSTIDLNEYKTIIVSEIHHTK